jgi:hypothetical protein
MIILMLRVATGRKKEGTQREDCHNKITILLEAGSFGWH